jgi:hypothetical protein
MRRALLDQATLETAFLGDARSPQVSSGQLTWAKVWAKSSLSLEAFRCRGSCFVLPSDRTPLVGRTIKSPRGRVLVFRLAKRRRLGVWRVSSQRSASGWGSGRRLSRSHAPNGVRCLDWPCIRSRPKARNPPTREAREARSLRATEFDCGASSCWIDRLQAIRVPMVQS